MNAGAQLAQSCHVCFAFAQEHSNLTHHWMTNSNYICIVNVDSQKELIDLMRRAEEKNIKFSFFREPDIDDEITAIALEPGNNSRKLTSRLNLALRNKDGPEF